MLQSVFHWANGFTSFVTFSYVWRYHSQKFLVLLRRHSEVCQEIFMVGQYKILDIHPFVYAQQMFFSPRKVFYIYYVKKSLRDLCLSANKNKTLRLWRPCCIFEFWSRKKSGNSNFRARSFSPRNYFAGGGEITEWKTAFSRIRRDRNSAYKTYLKYCQRVYKIIKKLEYICKAHDFRASSLNK
jgi:hypothetical protein